MWRLRVRPATAWPGDPLENTELLRLRQGRVECVAQEPGGITGSAKMSDGDCLDESQLVELKRQITAAGHVLAAEYIDDGYTGTLLDRPALNRMRADLKTDRFDRIYFLAADRIARKVEYQRIIVGELLST
jgi:hypothetical protein